MSLFASLGQGDIWALSGISFASAVNDILDKEHFTLEELLEEDELIQEVKSKNEQLIEFLCSEKAMEQLIKFIVEPCDDVNNEMRRYKYPYMSCEVVCCEVPEILNSLVEQHEGKYLRSLFSLLENEARLDNYLSGYFEKILEMLFRRMTVPMMSFLNDAGPPLLLRFLRHIDNYSIMQIVQRLMLPHIPFSSQQSDSLETVPYDEIKEHYQCNWSYINESCVLLLDRLFDDSNVDVPLHVSDLLITVLQLSPPETLVIKRLCDVESIERLLQSCVAADADTVSVASPFTASASKSLASISVLESLVSRLFESSLPFEQQNGSGREADNEHFSSVKASIDVICEQFVSYVPRMTAILRGYMADPPACESTTDQCRCSVPRLGHRGLQLVKLIESVVRLSSASVDRCMCEEGLFSTCLQLFYHFRANSLLHLSVQRIFITVIESDASRSATQVFVLLDCRLVCAVMATVGHYDARATAEERPPVEGDAVVGGYSASKHSSIMGNAVLIAQALSLALEPELHSNNADLSTSQGDIVLPTDGALREAADPDCSPHTDSASACGGSGFVLDNHASLRGLMSNLELLRAWDLFVDATLRPILEHQIGSSNVYPSSAMDFANYPAAQGDEMKLGVDFDAYRLDEDDDEDDDDFVMRAENRVQPQQHEGGAPAAQYDVWGDEIPEVDAFALHGGAEFVEDGSASEDKPVGENAFDFAGFADFESFNMATQPFSSDKPPASHDEIPAFADFPDGADEPVVSSSDDVAAAVDANAW